MNKTNRLNTTFVTSLISLVILCSSPALALADSAETTAGIYFEQDRQEQTSFLPQTSEQTTSWLIVLGSGLVGMTYLGYQKKRVRLDNEK